LPYLLYFHFPSSHLLLFSLLLALLLSSPPHFLKILDNTTHHSVLIAALTKKNGSQWCFHAIGEGIPPTENVVKIWEKAQGEKIERRDERAEEGWSTKSREKSWRRATLLTHKMENARDTYSASNPWSEEVK
jgi:hypothetical protein